MKKKLFKLSRREFIKKSSSTAAAIALANSIPIINSRPVYAAGKLKIGVYAPAHCAVSTVHAKITDNFKKNGLDVDLIYKPGMPELAKGLLTKELNAAQIISPLFFAINAGTGKFEGKATPLVTAQIGGTNGGTLIVGKNSNIKSPKDLKGKTIGMHSPMMVQNLLLKTLLERTKLDPGKDVALKIVPMPELIGALKKGEIDAFMNPEPLSTFSEVKGAGDKLLFTKNLWFGHPCCTIAVRKDNYESDSDTYKALWKSSMESQVVLNNAKTRNEVIERVHKDAPEFAKFPVEGLKKAFTPGRSDFNPFPFQSSGKALLTMMQNFKMMPESIDADKLVAEAFLSDVSKELLTSVGEKAPESSSRPEKIVGKVIAS